MTDPIPDLEQLERDYAMDLQRIDAYLAAGNEDGQIAARALLRAWRDRLFAHEAAALESRRRRSDAGRARTRLDDRDLEHMIDLLAKENPKFAELSCFELARRLHARHTTGVSIAWLAQRVAILRNKNAGCTLPVTKTDLLDAQSSQQHTSRGPR